MRIISGKFKGKKLFLPKDKNTRPLKDLVKESRFYEENDTCPTCDQNIGQDIKDSKQSVIKEKASELQQAKEDLKASAKAKLIAGEPLTAEEADTIVI